MVGSSLGPTLVLASLAGGVLGTVLGASPALGLAGLSVVVTEASRVLGGSGTGTYHSLGLTNAVGLGPVLGPHVAFAAGVASAAYVGRSNTIDETWPFHQAKQVWVPLAAVDGRLVVGAIFGLVGLLVARLSYGLGVPVDPIALAVVLSGFAHRVALGYPLLGRLGDDVLDMSGYARDERRGDADPEAETVGSRRFVVEPWQPHHDEWPTVAVLGVGVGLAAGILVLVTGSALLPFGLAASLVLLRVRGRDDVPVVYHMAFPASVVALGLGNGPAVAAVLAAGLVGLLGGLLGELAQRVCYAHADTHVDPAMASICLTSLFVSLLATAGVLQASVVPFPVV